MEQCARDLLVTSWGAAIDALRPMPPPLPGAVRGALYRSPLIRSFAQAVV